jgi:hypothetical protein
MQGARPAPQPLSVGDALLYLDQVIPTPLSGREPCVLSVKRPEVVLGQVGIFPREWLKKMGEAVDFDFRSSVARSVEACP